MKCRCDGCAKFFDTKQYAFYCDDCNDFFEETPVIDDSNCHCGPCTAMNEPLTLEGDIRYLKAHIETKDRQLAEKDGELAEAKLRIDIYREAWQDAEKGKTLLVEENEGLKEQILDLEQSNRDLKSVMNSIRHWLDKSIAHINDWSENG